MRIYLDGSWLKGQAHERDLHYLFRLVYDHGHTLHCRKDMDAWLSRQSLTYRTFCMDVLDAGNSAPQYHGVRGVRVEVAPGVPRFDAKSRCVQLPLGEALFKFLKAPLQVMVEDEQTDFGFLRKAVPPAWRDQFERAHKAGRIAPRHGGGVGAIKRTVRTLSDEDAVRVFVLLDSDRQAPGDPPSPDVTQAKQVIDQRGVALHVLRRRMVESYVPVPVLERWALLDGAAESRRPWLTALRALSPDQRFYVYLKPGVEGGFRLHGGKSSGRSPTVNARAVYGHLLTDANHPLWAGPPGELGAIWRDAPVSIEPVDFMGDDSEAEREHIFQAILGAA